MCSRSETRSGDFLNELVTFLQVTGQSCFEKYRVQSELSVEKWHVAKHAHQLVHADMPLAEVLIVTGQ